MYVEIPLPATNVAMLSPYTFVAVDVLNFYTTPVDMTAPYDKLKTMELPPNLHVLHDYYRFHPDTDTMFNGVSAFPKSSTIVSGLKTKKKYKGFDAGNPWNDI